MPYKDKNKLNPWKKGYNKDYHLAHRAQKAERDANRRKQRTFLTDLAKARPCTDCGGRFPACAMDWDHTQPNKTKNVSELRSGKVSKLFAEIAKCELVCANCHRVRTNKRLYEHDV